MKATISGTFPKEVLEKIAKEISKETDLNIEVSDDDSSSNSGRIDMDDAHVAYWNRDH